MAEHIVSLELAKQHLRVSGTSQDAIIEQYIEAAEEWIEAYIDGDIPGFNDSPFAVPRAYVQAALLLIGDFFANREAQTMAAGLTVAVENQRVVDLLFPLRQNLSV